MIEPTLSFHLNGALVHARAPHDARLLDVLREQLGHTEVKEGCGEGECGACTVLLDGQIINSCHTPAWAVEERAVVTVTGGAVQPLIPRVQEALIDAGAVQCGFCTPGFVLAISALLSRDPRPDDATIRAAISGNLCRCTGYEQIIDAARRVARGGKA